MAKTESAASPLEVLQSHFAALDPRKVKVKGLPHELHYHPLNAEQMFKYAAAQRSESPAQQARLFAELLVETVKLEDGKQAFPMVGGGPNPVEVLVTKAPPAVFAALVKELGKEAPVKTAEDIEKK